MLENLWFRARLCCRWSFTSMHVSGIVGFSPHANQKIFTPRERRSDTTRLHRRTCSAQSDSCWAVKNYQWREVSEPTRITRRENRKDFQMDERSKELRAPLPISDSSHASSLRPCDEMQEQLERSSKQARTAKKGVETLQDVLHLFQKGHCEHQRNGFLQVRMGGMCKSNKKKVLKKKDGERNLHFPSCTLDVQAALRETRRTEWNKWMKFNAGVILTDEGARQLTEAGCEIYPMKWVDTDKKRISAKK